MDPYILNKLQYTLLETSAAEGKPVFLKEPNPIGTLEERQVAIDELQLADDLITLGLLMDVSETKEKLVKECEEMYGYGVRFFLVTPNGLSMFHRKNLVVN